MEKICKRHLLPINHNFYFELNETFEKCAQITKTIGNFYDAIPACALRVRKRESTANTHPEQLP